MSSPQTELPNVPKRMEMKTIQRAAYVSGELLAPIITGWLNSLSVSDLQPGLREHLDRNHVRAGWS